MGLNGILHTAVSGLFANQRAIAATSENIANVNTENFARRDVNFFTDEIPGQFAGVDVEIARASVDRFLQSASINGNADAASSQVIADALSRIEASLGAPGSNTSFANKLDEAFASLTALSAIPSSAAAKADAVAALEAAFAAFARTEDAIGTEFEAAGAQLTLSVDRINAILQEIHRLNAVVADSDNAGDLIDTRISELSSYLDINVSRADDGRVSITTSDGTTLVNSGSITAFGVLLGPPSTLSLSAVDQEGVFQAVLSTDITNEISGGQLHGLLSLRNSDLTGLQSLVGNAAQSVANSLNAAYAQNVPVGSAVATTTPLIALNADGDLAVNSVIVGDPSQLAIARPSSGLPGGANDGLGAAALANVGSTTAMTSTREAIAMIGSAARNAENLAATNAAYAQELSSRFQADGGVNLDEELSNLIMYQRAYGANARVIAAVDELWQSLLSII